MELSNTQKRVSYFSRSLSFSRGKLIIFAVALLLPLLAHLLAAPVRLILPMHWPVILAALLYGPLFAAFLAILAPFLNHLFSGFPLLIMVLPLTLELLSFALLAGVSYKIFKLNIYLATFLALVGGRLIFLFFLFFSNQAIAADFFSYLKVAMLPGLLAALWQLLLLPFLSKLIEQRR